MRMWPWSRSSSVAGSAEPWPLRRALLPLSRRDRFTIGNAVENVLIVGGIGSGKTSGSGFALAMAYLRAGFGLLVLCAKSDEPKLWRRYCQLAGRLDDLIEFGPQAPWRFNPLAFELGRPGAGAGHTENLVQLLMTLLDLGEKDGGRGGKEGEAYWRKAILQLLRNLVDLLVLATGRVGIPELYRLATSTASSMDEVRSPEWRARSFCFRCLSEGDKQQRSASRQRDFELVADYFLLEWPAISDKTRSVILSSFTSMVDVLNRGMLRDLFTDDAPNIDPTVIELGKVVVVNMPLKEYGQVGLYAAALWKFSFMKSIERRDVTLSPRPVALWADEGHYFLLPGSDMLFTSTARSARVSNVLLTQSISGVIATLGSGPAGRAEADAYLSNYGTKIFHANTDPTTNEYAANLIGKCKGFLINGNNSYGGNEGGSDHRTGGSSGISEHVDFEIQPREFSKLLCGGAENRGRVEAIAFRNGSSFRASGKNWMRVAFTQPGRD
jgi:hypothetical protein